jgi:hypothetical protein
MTPRRWTIAGWACIAVAVVLAVAAIVQVEDAVRAPHPQLFNPAQTFSAALAAPGELMRGFISAVLAGVAFFTGLASFFWGALQASRKQMATILEQLRDGQPLRPS